MKIHSDVAAATAGRTLTEAVRNALVVCAVGLALGGCSDHDRGASDGGSGGSSGGTGGGTGGGSGGGTGGGTGGSIGPVVYLADQEIVNRYELYRVDPTDPGVSIKLSPALATDQDVEEFALSPDRKLVAYVADQDTTGRYELYVVDLSSPGVTMRVSAPMQFGRDVIDWAWSPDSQQIVYRADQDADETFELYRVDLSSPGVTTKVSASLTAGGWVRASFTYSPDGTRLVYRADQDQVDVPELYMVDMASPGVATQVHPTLVAGGAVYGAFSFSPDSQTIAYIADQDTDQVLELYSVPVSTPGNSDRLNGDLVAEGDVCRFEWSPDSARVAYCGDQDTDEVHELYVVELAQPGVSTKLNPALVPGGEVSPTFRFSPDSGTVYYIASQDTAGVDELYGVAVAAPQATTKLNDPLTNGGEVVWFRQRPDGSRLGYIADQEVDELYNLYEADPGNPGTAVRMTPDAAGAGVYDFLYSSDGTKIVYSSSQDDDFSDLYRLDTATPGDSTRLNAAMVAGGEVWSFNLTE